MLWTLTEIHNYLSVHDCVLAAGTEWAKLSNNFVEILLNLS